MSKRPSLDEIVLRKANAYEKGLKNLIGYGVKKSYLSAKGQRAWDIILEYKKDNDGQAPPDSYLLTEVWPESRVELNELPDTPLKYDSEDIINRELRREVKQLKDDIDHGLKQGVEETESVKDLVIRRAERLREMSIISNQAENLFDYFPKVIENYESYEEGELGIQTPWPTITNSILGWQEGSVHWVVARPGVGKTFFLLKSLLFAHTKGHKVLLVSPELSMDDLAERSVCLKFGISYEQFIEGTLGVNAKNKVESQAEEFKGETGFNVITSVMSGSKSEVESAIDQYDPDIIGLDSAYFLGDGRNRNEQIADVSPWTEEIANEGEKNRVVIATGQMNRRAKSEETTNMNNIYGSDAIGQDADVIYGLFSDDTMKTDNIVGVKPVKIRRGSHHMPFKMNFDMITMDLSEISDNVYDGEEQKDSSSFDVNF